MFRHDSGETIETFTHVGGLGVNKDAISCRDGDDDALPTVVVWTIVSIAANLKDGFLESGRI